MADCCLIKKVATVEVYENKNEVRAYGFMAGDRNTPVMEVGFKHLWGESNLSSCKLRWIIVDDVGSLLVGEVPITSDNTALINLPNELFTGDRRMKVQLTVASCDGERILNLQQFTDLKVINSLAPNEVVQPVYQLLINQLYDDTKVYLSQLETSYSAKYGSLETLYANSKASLEQYLVTAENGGNAEFLQGYAPHNFKKTEDTIAILKASTKYKLGEVVEVLGYYSIGDGAGHKRKIEATDDGSGVQLANGLWANIVPQRGINAFCFGLKNTGYQNDDETIIIQKYVDFCESNSLKCVFNFDNVWISDTIYLKGDIDGTFGRFVMPIINKPAFYVDMSIRKINGLYVDFYGGDSVDKKNRYLLLCDKIDRKELLGLRQFRGYGVIKMVEPSDVDLVKNNETKKQILEGSYGNHMFSNTIEVLSATNIKGIGLNLVNYKGGSTGNFFPNVYINRQNSDESLEPLIKMQSFGGGHVFGQLNLEWFNFGGTGAIALNDSEMVINELYFEGAICKARYTGFVNQFYKSDFVCKKIQFINCNSDYNTSIIAVNQDGNVDIDNIHIAGYAPFKDWNNNRMECVYFKTDNIPFNNAYGSVSIGNVYKREEQLINGENLCYNNGVYLYNDFEGLTNNQNRGITHPLKKLGNKMCVPSFYGTLKSDNSTFKKIGASQFDYIGYNNNLMLSDESFIIPEYGFYEVTYKANFGYGSRVLRNGLEVFISQGGSEEKATKVFVCSFSKGNSLVIENIGNDGVMKPNFYGFVSIKKIY